MIRYDIYDIWYNIWYDIWFDMILYHIWYDMIRYMIWYDIYMIIYDIYDMISYYIDFTLLYKLLGFPWALSLLSSLLCIIKVYCVDKGTGLLLVLRYEVLFSHWPGSYLLLNDFPLCAKNSRCFPIQY